jgi:hypothetical protein
MFVSGKGSGPGVMAVCPVSSCASQALKAAIKTKHINMLISFFILLTSRALFYHAFCMMLWDFRITGENRTPSEVVFTDYLRRPRRLKSAWNRVKNYSALSAADRKSMP